jgi:hypothetical protein
MTNSEVIASKLYSLKVISEFTAFCGDAPAILGAPPI